MTRTLAATAAIVALAGAASAQVTITEVFVGLSGEDGTNDWFEITNVSGADIDTGTLFYDDSGPNAGDGGALDSFILKPGKSAIFLIADSLSDFSDDGPENAAANVIQQFYNVWGLVPRVGITNGGGGLSQGGDSVNISFDSGTTFPVDLTYTGTDVADTATTDNVSGLALSQVGVNGAYVSNGFFNDNVGTGAGYTLIGSPGLIPAPGAFALAGIAGLAANRRRRA